MLVIRELDIGVLARSDGACPLDRLSRMSEERSETIWRRFLSPL
jgi:hypothetical protein